MLNMAKVFTACLILTVSVPWCCGSAIPIWEFLTRNEKMSYLYSTFAQLVSVHCKATASTSLLPVNQCKHNLLGYGYEKLQTFSDQQLDAFDPYQRGSSEIIWSSIMRDHPSSRLITTRKPLPTPPASSLIIMSHQTSSNKSPGQHFQQAIPTTTPNDHHHDHDQDHNQHYHQPFGKNPMFQTDAEHHHQYAMDMDVAYGYPVMAANPQVDTFNYKPQEQQHHHLIDSKMIIPPQQQQPFSPPHTYLTGPLVFRVRPDGSPVEEDQHKPLPRDDDLEEYHITMATDRNTNDNNHSNNNNNNNKSDQFGDQNIHHKVATISSLKQQQQLTTLALQQQLQPPLQQQQQQQRLRRHYQIPVNQPHQSSVNGFIYSRRQA